MEPPPLIPDINEQLLDYLICPEHLSIHEYERNQEFWPYKPEPNSLLNFEGFPLTTTLKVKRNIQTGEIIDFFEVPIEGTSATAKNSTSLNRAPGPPSERVRGSAFNFPFWPSGLEEPISKVATNEEILTDLLTVPPGFPRGLNLHSEETVNKTTINPVNSDNIVNLLELVKDAECQLDIWKNPDAKQEQSSNPNKEQSSEFDDVIPNETAILRISEVKPFHLKQSTEFAILLDSNKPVKDFRKQIPEMAHKYEFELDTFQKQAILQLEQHNHVFVAAHTSAGKTVVAEYAIALSEKHMTKTIYTSPIKALSNQKYRDFKRTFKDVGLVTGDFQINQTARCLIMTTEILRSMLCCGSDIIRDLEYVIFDEVHYINDKFRGHVWEQVFMLLPKHVCVVMLSATVPNTIEFADWLGSMYKKPVYVVTTYKRPVPLRHYLYTGTGGKTKDNRFLILGDKWEVSGYHKAKETISPATSHRMMDPGKQRGHDKTLFTALVDHLRRNGLLPAVLFMFSRAKCDQLADTLLSLDLTDAREKAHIHHFFQQCVRGLREEDREIPQIVRMREWLGRGIGVHHSGILPIMKEVVEMLFQEGYLKLLFATETFAMGVNMPARTVLFHSVTKFDGTCKRALLPAEYIQMAGRAGRRGLDSEGTVIILCKGELPTAEMLQGMMLGDPSKLESQMRITYSMILSFSRVDSLSMEDMLSRSFREVEHLKRLPEIREKLLTLEELSTKQNKELSPYLQPLILFYEKARNYLDTRADVMDTLMLHPRMVREMKPGKFLVITHLHHVNKLAMLLSSSVKGNKVSYKVLILTEEMEKSEDDSPQKTVKKPIWYKMLALAASSNIYHPRGATSHQVVIVSADDVFEVCAKSSKVDTDLVMKDWEKRQIPRFKDDPPGATCQSALLELSKQTLAPCEYLDMKKDLKLNEQQVFFYLNELNKLRDLADEQSTAIQMPNFEECFNEVFEIKYVEDQKQLLELQLSHASMSLYPDYMNRVQLLKLKNYIDENNRIQLKGRVACEMGMNELLMTELIFQNILTRLEPNEVAALLSSLVFQKKPRDEVNFSELPQKLQNAIYELKEIHRTIRISEREVDVLQSSEDLEELNFELVDVVYQWASNMPFAEIMNLTEEQEGIIVRCIVQLNETLSDIKNGARLIGDPALYTKMCDASTAIKRDIVFAESLYTQK